MNEKFSGRGPGTRARENRGCRGALGGVWEMGEERTGDGSSKRVEGGRNRGKLPSTALQSKNG